MWLEAGAAMVTMLSHMIITKGLVRSPGVMACHATCHSFHLSVHTEVVAMVATSIPVSWLTCFHINCHETQVVIVTVPTAPFMPGVAPAWMR